MKLFNSNRLVCCIASLSISISVYAVGPNYDVVYTSTGATIDGIVSPGEWDEADQSGDWKVLRTNANDTHGNYIKSKWNESGIFLLYSTNYTNWDQKTSDQFDWNTNSINLYFDPNQDQEALDRPAEELESYQIALNLYQGSAEFDGSSYINTVGYEDSASNSKFNNTAWDGLGSDSRMAMNNGAQGGVLELFIKWQDFNVVVDDNDMLVTSSPTETTTPWSFQIGAITTDGSNFLPVWNDNGGQAFVDSDNGWGTLTFLADTTTVGTLGDTDGDDDVDLDDYYTLLEFIGQSGSHLTVEHGDVNRDKIVDLHDYAIIEREFEKYNNGNTLASSIPEPASLFLLTISTLIFIKRN